MSKLIYGHRIGRYGHLTPCCCAIIFDESREKLLLTKRSDNQRWCLPGGAVESGESASEGCIREVLEETGLLISIEKLVGIYSNPHYLVEYPDGNRIQPFGICFEGIPRSGELCLSEETIGFGYFSLAQIDHLEVVQDDLIVIKDGFTNASKPFIR